MLLSGGLDSAVAAACARRDGFALYALSLDYGQRHRAELDAAARVAQSLHADEHRMVTLDLRAIGGSALTGEIAVPKDRPPAELEAGIPVTYVPARNLIFLSLAAGYAEVIGAHDLYIGVNAIDYSGYPDCRPEFIESFQRTVNLATRAGVEGHRFTVHAPLARLTKAGIIGLGRDLGVDLALTHSCYDPDHSGAACGRCDSCLLRRRGFEEAGIPDPTRYGAAEARR